MFKIRHERLSSIIQNKPKRFSGVYFNLLRKKCKPFTRPNVSYNKRNYVYKLRLQNRLSLGLK